MRSPSVGPTCLAFAAVLAAASPSLAIATTLGFEDLDRGSYATGPLPAGYAGFTWRNVAYVARPPAPPMLRPSVYFGTIGRVSLVSSTTSSYAFPPAVLSRPERFTFQGVCLTALSWFDQVVVEGFRGDARVYAQTVDVLSDGPSCFVLDFADVSEVRVVPSWGPVVLDELQVVVPDTIPPYLELTNVPPPFVQDPRTWLAGRVFDAGGIAEGTIGSFRNGEVTVPLVVDALGQFAALVPLVEGPNAILLQAVDLAGNPGSRIVNVIRDTSPPVVELLSPDQGAVFTTVAAFFTVRVTDLTPVSSLLVEVFKDGAVLEHFTVPVGGPVVSFAYPALQEGRHTVRVTAADVFGHQGSASTDVTWDLSGPAVSVDVEGGARFGPLAGDVLQFHVTVADPSPTVVTAPFTRPIAVPAGGQTVALEAPLVEGHNEIAFEVTDAGGRTTPVRFAVAYDTTPPSAKFLSPAPGAALRGAVEVALGASDDTTGVAGVTFSVDGGPAVPAIGAGPYQATLDLGGLVDGWHDIGAIATDGVGNVAAPRVRVLVDDTRPAVAIEGPAAGTYVRGVVSVSVVALDATSGVASVEVRGNGGPIATCTGAGPCAGSIDTSRLPDGPFEVTAVALDRAGNESVPARLRLVADNSAPARFVTSPLPGAIVLGTVDVAVEVGDAGFAFVECAAGDLVLGRSTDPRFAARVELAAFLDGPLAISCTAGDLAGNVATETVLVTVRNWSLAVAPATLHLGSGGGGTVTVQVEGANVALLARAVPQGLALVVPGGSPVPLDVRAAAEQPADSDHDGVPELTLKFERAALVSSIEGAIAAGGLRAPGLVPVALVGPGDRRLGTVRVDVR